MFVNFKGYFFSKLIKWMIFVVKLVGFFSGINVYVKV